MGAAEPLPPGRRRPPPPRRRRLRPAASASARVLPSFTNRTPTGDIELSIPVIAILRSAHIVFGAFWLGGVVSLGFFFVPWLRALRPLDAESVARVLTARRLLTVVAISGVIAVAAGHILYYGLWQGSGLSGPGFWYAAGGQPANIAVLLTSAIAWLATGLSLCTSFSSIWKHWKWFCGLGATRASLSGDRRADGLGMQIA